MAEYVNGVLQQQLYRNGVLMNAEYCNGVLCFSGASWKTVWSGNSTVQRGGTSGLANMYFTVSNVVFGRPTRITGNSYFEEYDETVTFSSKNVPFTNLATSDDYTEYKITTSNRIDASMYSLDGYNNTATLTKVEQFY